MLRLPAQLVLFTLLLGFVSAASSKDFTFGNPSTLSSTQFLPVDEAYKADVLAINDSNKLSLFWQIEPKHFLYRHGFAVEWFSTKEINTHGKEQLNLSDGIAKEDPYFGPVEIYYQSVEIDLPIILSDETLYIKATSQGCADAGLCYPPYSLFFSVNPDGSVSPLDKQTYQDKKLQLHPASPPKIKEKSANASLIKIISILFAAFLGGLILNLMPCVLPILSLKVFQMANQQDHKQRQSQGMAYLVGVILSFLLVAIIMITLKAAGNQIGWGFQLQNAWFIITLVYLFFTLGLSLSGFIHFGSGIMGAGQSLTEKGGLKGSFFTGVLAVIVASPCTAPFMGSALGFAATQPPWIALLIFAALGLGMALPLTLISFMPTSAKWLPKPGAWMEKLKEFFAYPLYLTAIWLLWVLGKQAGVDAMAVGAIGCLLIALGLWFLHRFSKVGGFFAISTLLLALLLIPLPTLLHNLEKSPDHLTFSQEKLDRMRSEGQAVFLDLTADWCITCKANEATTLNTNTVQSAFKDANIAYMIGDWTNANPEITALLNRHERNGIPLYLLYPATPMAPAMILPQILTKGIVLEAIDSIIHGKQPTPQKSK